ncbi:MAG TPA: YtxH domain-containing protein [Thermoflexales bacterium]|nr:YtxH domain-containing protein [Thermoflexales bacterium]HRA01041.1 YtxH domain-containing protein [Thermoflexales bacterium]
MGTFFNFIAGAVLGGLIGGAAGTILAPKSGNELRKQIRREVNAILDEGRKAADDRESELRQQLAVLRGDEQS